VNEISEVYTGSEIAESFLRWATTRKLEISEVTGKGS
jgi:hypothetical protein